MVWDHLEHWLCTAALLLGAGSNAVSPKAAAVSAMGATAGVLQVFPESPLLTFSGSDAASTIREVSTVLRVWSSGGSVSASHPVEVLVSVFDMQALRSGGKGLSLDAATLRVRNDRGEWTPLAPLPELNGRLGVRIAVVRSAPATCVLQVQLHLPAGQRAGNYSGLLNVEAQNQ